MLLPPPSASTLLANFKNNKKKTNGHNVEEEGTMADVSNESVDDTDEDMQALLDAEEVNSKKR